MVKGVRDKTKSNILYVIEKEGELTESRVKSREDR